ncbi:MAG: hypothetical protein E3J21_26290 [Anaerolineales bacterium]|nr:MAG: hypothetical protein E3J21_26290 [Anaerolineales bacterium]
MHRGGPGRLRSAGHLPGLRRLVAGVTGPVRRPDRARVFRRSRRDFDSLRQHLGQVYADPVVVEVLAAACRERGARVHVGGNASCEALYRITPQMAKGFRERGCLCMENGEASTLFAVTRALGVLGGVLFQPYIELAQGWNPARLDEVYRTACHLQAEAVLEASVRLGRQGLLES